MPVVNTDMVLYGSAVMPEDEVTLDIGGAIDTGVRVVFTDIDATGTIEVVSDNAGDNTQNVTVTGRNAAGEVITDTVTLNGTTLVAITGSFQRIIKAEIDAAHSGVVTLRKSGNAGDLMLFESGVTTIRRVFIGAVADVAGGAALTFYEKVFMKNTNGATALTAALVKLTNTLSGKLSFALATALDDTVTNGAGNNRSVAPAALTFDAADKTVANSGNHSPGTAQGIWLKLTLPAGEPAFNGVLPIVEQGSST